MRARQILLTATTAGLLLSGSSVAVASAHPTVKAPPKYSTCKQMNKAYPHGVGLKRAHDKTRSHAGPVTNFLRNDRIYKANTDRDADNDGVACEKH